VLVVGPTGVAVALDPPLDTPPSVESVLFEGGTGDPVEPLEPPVASMMEDGLLKEADDSDDPDELPVAIMVEETLLNGAEVPDDPPLTGLMEEGLLDGADPDDPPVARMIEDDSVLEGQYVVVYDVV